MRTKIAGIPCTVDFRVTGEYVPAKTNAPPESCYEAEYPEIDFTVCDQRGRPAPWLEEKMTPEDVARIEIEILESV